MDTSTIERPAAELPAVELPAAELPTAERPSRLRRIGASLLSFGQLWSAAVAAAYEVDRAATPEGKKAAADRFAAYLNR